MFYIVNILHYNISEVFFLNRIKDLRIEKNISQTRLAKVLSTTQRSINHYETGKRNPDIKKLTLLSDYFNVSIDYLLCKSDIRNSNKIIDDFNLLSKDSKKELERYMEILKLKDMEERNKITIFIFALNFLKKKLINTLKDT